MEQSAINALSELIEQGISIIPVSKDGKVPFEKFKGTDSLSLLELIDSGKSGKFAIRVGSGFGASDGLVGIDIDSKYKEGFDQRIWLDIKGLYPEIFEKLVVDKSPSGGLHFYYKVGWLWGSEIKSCDPSSRAASEEELLRDPNRKKYTFIEFKATDGHLITCYPSDGYKRIKGSVFFELSESEHKCLMSLLFQYNEIERVEPIRIRSHEKGIYKEGMTAFDMFNISEEGGKVFDELGWRFLAKVGSYERYARPENKTGNWVSGTYDSSNGIYKIFTSSTSLEQKGFNPSSLLCFAKYGNDWGKLGADLASRGYGVLKESVEKNLLKKALRDGSELPANISKSGKEKWEGERLRVKEKWYCGEFWEEVIVNAGEVKWRISREKLYLISEKLGFFVFKEKLVYIDDWIVKIVNERFYFNFLKSYMGDSVSEDLKDCYEAFLQASGKFSISRLGLLDETLLLKSSKVVSYKFYKNCFICISVDDGICVKSYEEIEEGKIVWFHDIKNRDFYLREEGGDGAMGLYNDFIENAIGWSSYTKKCIGYLAHDYRDEEGYWVIATERCENPKDGGGSGKNVFCSLFELITTFKSTPASMIKFDNNLLQSWDGQRIFCLSDIPKKFEIIFFKDIITGNAVVNKKYINEYSIAIEDMCKMLGSSNFSFDNSDPGIKRRVRALEFTEYYTLRGGVRGVTGKMFPKDWTEEDYLEFDRCMMDCILEFLKGDGIIELNELSSGGWVKQFEQMYTHLYAFIETYIDDWVSIGRVSKDYLNMNYSEFLKENNIFKGLSAHTINKALEGYCSRKGIQLVIKRKVKTKNGEEEEDGISWRDQASGKIIRGRYFGEEAAKYIKNQLEEVPF